MSDKTQFIVITHRRGTMEEADVLYGVTMQEQGVSRMLTINLNEVEEGASISNSQGVAFRSLCPCLQFLISQYLFSLVCSSVALGWGGWDRATPPPPTPMTPTTPSMAPLLRPSLWPKRLPRARRAPAASPRTPAQGRRNTTREDTESLTLYSPPQKQNSGPPNGGAGARPWRSEVTPAKPRRILPTFCAYRK